MERSVLISKLKKRLEILLSQLIVPVQSIVLCGHMCSNRDGTRRELELFQGRVWQGARYDFELSGSFCLGNATESTPCLSLDLGRSPSLESLSFLYGPEACVYIDGKLVFGIDPNHSIWPLPPEYCDGNKHEVFLRGWTGIKDEPYQVGFTGLAAENLALRQYTDLLSICFETAQNTDDLFISSRLMEAADASLQLIDMSFQGISLSPALIKSALNTLNDKLKEIPCIPKHRVTACGHGHLDLAWLWRCSTAKGKALRTISNALSLMARYPSFHYSQSQAQLYKWIEEQDSSTAGKIKQAVEDGKWEIVGGMWVEPDCNITGAESLVRQILLFNGYMLRRFGTIGSPVVWLPDTFGFPAQLPQIMKDSGLKYFSTAKLTWNQYNRMPSESFIWRGLDGSQVLSHIVSTTKPKWWGATYSADLKPEELISTAAAMNCNHPGSHDFIVTYGMGDGGGGPTERMVRWSEYMEEGIPGLPALRTGTFYDFFRELEITQERLPVWENDLYLELHRGTYTNQSNTKRRNRLCEIALHNSEFLSAWAWDAAGADYPEETFSTLWQEQCLQQFHDILPGSSIHEVYEDEEESHRRILNKCTDIIASSLGQLECLMAADSILCLVNGSPYPFTGVVEVPEKIEVCSLICNGKSIPSFLLDGRLCVFVEDVPPYGFLCLSPSSTGTMPEELSQSGSLILENELVKIVFDESGDISSWFDKEVGYELAAPGARIAQWQLFEDLPGDWDAWDIDEYYSEIPPVTAKLVSARRYHAKGTADWLIMEKSIGESTITEQIELLKGSRQLRFSCHLDWKEKHRMLRSVSRFNIHSSGMALYGTQFGAISRPTHYNTSWEQARFENCMQGWADLSEGSYGVGIASDCKYGVDIHNDCISLAIQRSALFPDETAENGEHEFTFSIIPHKGSSPDEVRRTAYALANPVISYCPVQAGGKQSRQSMVFTNNPNIIIETVKLAESGDGIIIRAYEGSNSRGTCIIQMYRNICSCLETNLIETSAKPIRFKGSSAELDYLPYKIKTIKIN